MTTLLETPIVEGHPYRWDRMGSLPRKGWVLIDVEDMEEPTHTCQACGNPSVRYIHHLEHEEVVDNLSVGCVCSGHLTEDYETSEATERILRNRQSRLRKVLELYRWQETSTGNRKIAYKGKLLVLYPARFADGWRINVGEKLGQKNHPTEEAAIRAAFAYLDPPVIRVQ